MKLGVIREGKYAGPIAEGPESATGGLLGSNCGVSEFDGMMAAIEACDALGLDGITTGGVLGFTMECVQRGILTPKDLDGVNLEWGNTDAMVEMIRKIAYKEGKAGVLLGKGVDRMAKEIGKGSEAFAVTAKGKEIAAHDPRGDKGRGYSYAMGTCGGDHHEGTDAETLATWCMINSLVMCSFVGGYPWGKEIPGVFTEMLNPLCGWNMTGDEFWKAAKRIMTIERAFQVREGVSRKDDVLPKRFPTEPLPEGPKKGAIYSAEDTKKMQDSVYGYFGWDGNGIPTEKTLNDLGLKFAVADMKKAGKVDVMSRPPPQRRPPPGPADGIRREGKSVSGYRITPGRNFDHGTDETGRLPDPRGYRRFRAFFRSTENSRGKGAAETPRGLDGKVLPPVLHPVLPVH
jgi:aldehyde:ferredoxin oxidoreductase